MGEKRDKNSYLNMLSKHKYVLIFILVFFSSITLIYEAASADTPTTISYQSLNGHYRNLTVVLNKYPDPTSCKLYEPNNKLFKPDPAWLWNCNGGSNNPASPNSQKMPPSTFSTLELCGNNKKPYPDFNDANPALSFFLSPTLSDRYDTSIPNLAQSNVSISNSTSNIQLIYNGVLAQCVNENIQTDTLVKTSSSKIISADSSEPKGKIKNLINLVTTADRAINPQSFKIGSTVTYDPQLNFEYSLPPQFKNRIVTIKAAEVDINTFVYKNRISYSCVYDQSKKIPSGDNTTTSANDFNTCLIKESKFPEGYRNLFQSTVTLNFKIFVHIDVTGRVVTLDSNVGVGGQKVLLQDYTSNKIYEAKTLSDGTYKFTSFGNNPTGSPSAGDNYRLYLDKSNTAPIGYANAQTSPGNLIPGHIINYFCSSTSYDNQQAKVNQPDKPGYQINNNQASSCTPPSTCPSNQVCSLDDFNSYNFAYQPISSQYKCSTLSSDPANPEVGQTFSVMGNVTDTTSSHSTLNGTFTIDPGSGLSYPSSNSVSLNSNSFSLSGFKANAAGQYSISGLVNSSGVTLPPCKGTISIVNKPYLKVIGANIISGSNFASNVNGCTTGPVVAGNIYGNGYLTGGSYNGTSTDHLIFATNTVSGFASYKHGDAPPKQFTIPNNFNNVYGGGINSVSVPPDTSTAGFTTSASGYCVPDYYAMAKSSKSPAPVDPGGTLTLIGKTGLGAGNNRYVYDRTCGDVYINKDASTSGSSFAQSILSSTPYNQLPMMYVIVKGGNIYIDPSITTLAGVYIAEPDSTCPNGVGGKIFDCAPGGATTQSPFTQCTNKLLVEGSFIANQIVFDRTNGTAFKDNQATEVAICGDPSSNPNAAEEFCTPPVIWLANPFSGSANINYMSEVPPTL